jgi:drug/metabolite transporter (DMT)-like permease
MTTIPRSENLGLGILLTLLAFLSVAIMSALAKAVSVSVAAQVTTFFQNFISLLLFLPWILRRGITDLRTERFGLHLVRAISGLLSQYLLFVALRYIPLVDGVLLANAAPLFIPLVVWVWLKQRIQARLWASLIIGFIGIVLILQPRGGALNWAASLALLAGICSAVALVSVGRLDLTEPPARILFFYFAISSVLTAPFVVARWSTPEPRTWLYLAGVGVTMAIAQLLLILAYRQTSTSGLAPFNYSVVVFSGLIGWLVWNQVPNMLSIVGMVLVAAGSIYSTMQHRTSHPQVPTPFTRRGLAGQLASDSR